MQTLQRGFQGHRVTEAAGALQGHSLASGPGGGDEWELPPVPPVPQFLNPSYELDTLRKVSSLLCKILHL